MKSANAIYKIIKALNAISWYEIRIVQGNNVYGLDTLESVSVNTSLSSTSGIGIGSANAAECKITLREQSTNWPRMAQFTVQFRLCSGNYSSNWMTVGTFYTDERAEDKYGNLSIVAFDKMLMMEQSWTDKIPEELLPASYPITAYAWAYMIQEAGLATFNDLNQLDDTVEFVGLDTTTTIRDVLKSIAAVHAGNWVMTSDEKLKLIQYENLDISQATSSQYVSLGRSMKDFDDSPALDPVSGVHLETEAGTVMEDGDDTGYMLRANCSVSTTTGVAELCLSRIEGYVYKPFSATGAFLDPIADIGDQIEVDGVLYQLMSAMWNFSKLPIADIEAPYDQEIDHEYTIVSQDAKNYRKAMAAVDEKMGDYVAWDEFSTAIEQNEQAITLVASHTFVTQDDFDEEIANIQNQLDGNIQSWSGNVVPTLNNAPAVDWTTSALRSEHVGDMYFINSDAGIPEAGQYYRFEENNGVYSWQLITDSAITEALAQAAAALAAAESAQDTADEASAEAQLKGRVFVVQPTPPYSVGDLWFNSTESVIKVCMTARESGSFVDSDWVKRDKYTDDSAFLAFQDTYSQTIAAIQDQVDKKAETYYQAEDPANEWIGAAIAGIAIAGINVVGIETAVALSHKGDLWYRTTDNTTWFWTGSEWEQQDVPDEVFDKIDGKAQIFVSTPYTPYNIGDLWFNSANSDIMTCTVARATGDFNQGDWEKRNKYTDDSALTSFINATYSPAIAAIQSELDGKVDTYFYNYEPTLSNVPASGWNTDAKKDEHVDDLFYNTSTGYTYRFTKSGNTYSWTRVKDSDITTAMAAASTAQDTADGKRRVFVSQPTNAQAYDVGDLWVNATYGTTYNNDILRCKTAKAEGASFNISHWEKASRYTDDSALNTFVNATYNPEIAALQSTLDGKIDTWFYTYAPTLQNAPASTWDTNDKKDAHVDDLFFDTVSGYTYRFTKNGSTYSWSRIKDEDIDAAMAVASLAQDTADGKRRVFVSQPTNADEYDIGDLWVNATYGNTYSNDLLRCKTAKAAGASFNIAHWDKASKYTDDTTANTVAQALVTFESSFSVEPSQISAEISKNVVKDKQSTKTTFGWLLSDTAHTWYANNQEVMKVQQSGLSVTGSITATSGYIGNGSSGFEIGSTHIRNGMTSLSDTTHNGVYVGTDGVALGGGKFKVTSAGSVTASDMTITGGSISIKDGNNNVIFSANQYGVTVNGNGTFTGTVYAGNIVSGADVQGAGYFDGAGIEYGTVTGGGQYGQIAQYTLGDYNIARAGDYGAITPASFSEGVQASLTNADIFGLATSATSGEYPPYFCASSIRALRGVTGNELYVDYGDETTLSVSNHYHRITVNNDGTVTFGVPYNSNTPPSFNVADTHAYRDAVSAITVTSLDIEYEYDNSMHIYKMWGIAKNASQTTVYRTPVNMPWNTDRSAYVDGKADGADEVTVDTVTQYSYSSTGDKSVTIENGYLRYSNGQLIGRVNISLDGNDNTATCVISMDGQRAVDDARPRNIVRRTNLATGAEMPDTWNTTTNTGYVYLRATTNNSGIYVDQNIEVNTSSAIYQAGVTAGQGSVSITASGLSTTTDAEWRDYDQSIEFGANSLYTISGKQYGRIQITAGGSQRKVRVGMPSGSSVDSITVSREYGDERDWDFIGNSVYINVQLAAKNGNTTVFPDTGKVNVDDIVNFWAENAYDHVSVLETTSSTYRSYNNSLAWGINLYNPDITSSSVYGRIGIYNGDDNPTLLSTVRLSLSITATAASTSSDYSDYYTSGGRWYLRVHVKNGTKEIYQTGIDVQHAVDYGAAQGGYSNSVRMRCNAIEADEPGYYVYRFYAVLYGRNQFTQNAEYTFYY